MDWHYDASMRQTIPNSPGERVRAIRCRKGLTIAALAKMAGMVPSTIFRIEVSDRGLNPEHLRLVAKALRVTVKSLRGVEQ